MAATEASTIVEDLKDERIPNAMYWTVDQVAEWIEELGFPHYKSCFTTNMIDGRKLIRIEASAFPRVGITDFEHIKIIAKSIRDLLTVEEPDWTRSISVPPRSNLGMYLELKSARGKQIDTTTLVQFEQQHSDPKWRPPLANHCLILPHN
ncbi:sterile alpha motif domain-containing protein 15-like [Littorina saxatilis]|uniref:SAM domain-containing protein n=1 Tax=Littorina saxatilis TaxID=31220 RepID=A0AAN9B9Z8_9CAEN